MARKQQTDFQRLATHLKKKHKITQRRLARLLETDERIVSSCMKRSLGYTGDKFVPKLQIIIDILEDKFEVETQYCTYCNNCHVHHIEEWNKDGTYKCYT